MIMRLIEMIKQGQYTTERGQSTWNRMGNYWMDGGTIYDFGNGVTLKTYTGEYWFLRVDGNLVRLPVDDMEITVAFAEQRQSKARSLF